jgi:hypothetical protein
LSRHCHYYCYLAKPKDHGHAAATGPSSSPPWVNYFL